MTVKCAAPNCGEPISGEARRGQHKKCYEYHRKKGIPRPAPASVFLPGGGNGREIHPETLESRARVARGVDYRNSQLDGLVARIEEKMRNYA